MAKKCVTIAVGDTMVRQINANSLQVISAPRRSEGFMKLFENFKDALKLIRGNGIAIQMFFEYAFLSKNAEPIVVMQKDLAKTLGADLKQVNHNFKLLLRYGFITLTGKKLGHIHTIVVNPALIYYGNETPRLEAFEEFKNLYDTYTVPYLGKIDKVDPVTGEITE